MVADTVLLHEDALTDGGVLATLTLHRPDVRNAINLRMVQELGAVLEALAARSELRAVVVTGAGEKAFAAGADIAELHARRLPEAFLRINAAVFQQLADLPVPTIAAIRGFALGGGCELAMACDLRIAGRSARLGQPEVSLGIIAGAGALQRLPRLVGLGRAKELILSGRVIDAAEAERIGLVNRVVEDDDVLSVAYALAAEIAAQSPLAVRVSKAALDAHTATGRPSDVVDMLGQAILFESADKDRRMSAFLERKNREKKS